MRQIRMSGILCPPGHSPHSSTAAAIRLSALLGEFISGKLSSLAVYSLSLSRIHSCMEFRRKCELGTMTYFLGFGIVRNWVACPTIEGPWRMSRLPDNVFILHLYRNSEGACPPYFDHDTSIRSLLDKQRRDARSRYSAARKPLS